MTLVKVARMRPKTYALSIRSQTFEYEASIYIRRGSEFCALGHLRKSGHHPEKEGPTPPDRVNVVTEHIYKRWQVPNSSLSPHTANETLEV